MNDVLAYCTSEEPTNLLCGSVPLVDPKFRVLTRKYRSAVIVKVTNHPLAIFYRR
jgi:hypothetical protein